MSRLLWFCCLTVRVLQAQDLETQAAALRALVAQAPKLPLQRMRIKIQAEIGYPSSVAMDANGAIYVLQRG